MSQIQSKLIADLAITETKLNAGAVTENKIGAYAVTSGKIGADAVDGTKIADNAIDSEHYADASIDAEHLSTGAKAAPLQSKYAAFMNKFASFAAGSGQTAAITNEALTVANTKTTGGSGSVKGLVTGSPNNKCFIVDHATQDEIQDSSARRVFGRQTKSTNALTGTMDFTNGDATVSGTGTLFQSELAVGDWIQRTSDSRAYKVLSIASDTSLELTETYAGTTGTGVTADELVITLSYYVIIADVETAHTMAGQTIDVMIPESFDLYDSPFMGFINGIGYAEALPASHTHDDRYFTETELGTTSGTTGADRIGVDNTSVVGMTGTNVQDGFEQVARKGRYEQKTIVAQDTIPDLTYTPREATSVVLVVGNVVQQYGASKDYTVSGKAVTWYQATAGFHIEAGDIVWAIYDSSD